MNRELTEKALKILNAQLDPEITPTVILAMKGMSLETGLTYINANAETIMGFDVTEYELTAWSKVPIDTLIYVKDLPEDKWKIKHFAGYYAGMVHAYVGGQSSRTAEDGFVPWNYAKLAEPIHEEKEFDANRLDSLLNELNNCPKSVRDVIKAKIYNLVEK